MKHCFLALLSSYLLKDFFFLPAKHAEEIVFAALNSVCSSIRVKPGAKKIQRACCCERTVVTKTSPGEPVDIFIDFCGASLI